MSESKAITKFEDRINKILTAEGDVNDILDSLDGEDESSHLPETVEYDKVDSVIISDDNLNQDTVNDYKHVRNTLYGLIDRGTVALEGALMIARESEHPRAYEVASSLMKNISEVSKDLLQLQGNLKSDIKIGKQVNNQTNIYNTAHVKEDPKEINNLLDDLDD